MKKSPDVSEIVGNYVRRKRLFEPGEKILAAVSGGPDSLCLALVLRRLGFDLCIAHFDHHLRLESARDAETVRRAAERLGLPFRLGQGDVTAHAGLNRMTMEEAARDLRYSFLLRIAKEEKINIIATGHTMNDQAETVLMHLIRGSGLNGLGGIRPVGRLTAQNGNPEDDPVRIVRPLLCITREQAAGHCAQEGWVPLDDPTNRDPAFTRNKIRLELIPLLKQYNPSIVDALARLAETAQVQDAYFTQTADRLWAKSAVELAPGLVRFPVQAFRNEHAAVRQALLRRAVFHLEGTLEDLSYRQVERVLEFVQSPSGPHRMDLALGVQASIERDWLVLRSRKDSGAPEWEGTELPCPGILAIHHPEWRIEVAQTGQPERIGLNAADPWKVRIDPDRVRMPLTLRKRKTGDKFFPQGMMGRVSLNDFLSSHHMPPSERDHWPLVCDQDEIIWIPGFRLKQGIDYTEESRNSLAIRVERFG